MKDIVTFRTFNEYEEFVLHELMYPIITDHPFYRKLIRFVLRNKAPIFYYMSDISEYRNFSLYYNFILIRKYDNPIMRALYFLHDFVHSLFYYPHDMTAVTPEEFDRTVIEGEYAASNETEILVHYRIPTLREKVFKDQRIFFDALVEHNIQQPRATQLLALRKALIETDNLDIFFLGPHDEDIKAQLKSYRGNAAWCKHRFSETIKLHNPTEFFYPFLTPSNYERTVNGMFIPAGNDNSGYRTSATRVQEDFERVSLMNMRLMFDIMNINNPPKDFNDIKIAASLLEGKILFYPEGGKCC